MTCKNDKSLRKKYKIKNWPEHDVALKNIGGITFWLTKERSAANSYFLQIIPMSNLKSIQASALKALQGKKK